jgi:hypothetical protein
MYNTRMLSYLRHPHPLLPIRPGTQEGKMCVFIFEPQLRECRYGLKTNAM